MVRLLVGREPRCLDGVLPDHRVDITGGGMHTMVGTTVGRWRRSTRVGRPPVRGSPPGTVGVPGCVAGGPVSWAVGFPGGGPGPDMRRRPRAGAAAGVLATVEAAGSDACWVDGWPRRWVVIGSGITQVGPVGTPGPVARWRPTTVIPPVTSRRASGCSPGVTGVPRRSRARSPAPAGARHGRAELGPDQQRQPRSRGLLGTQQPPCPSCWGHDPHLLCGS